MVDALGPFLGPILFLRDVAWENQVWGIVFCLLLIPGMLAPLVKPSWWAAGIGLLSVLGWLFLGMIGMSIDC